MNGSKDTLEFHILSFTLQFKIWHKNSQIEIAIFNKVDFG
jgi:hypothetical protein